MPRSVSRPTLMKACLDAISEAERSYSKWTGGFTMRSAPESLVQTFVAQALAEQGATVFLEASVKRILSVANGEDSTEIPGVEGGRVDVAVFYKSKGKAKTPRFILEIKKLSTHHSLDEDYRRITEILEKCPKMQNGIMIGYTTAVNAETVDARIKAVTDGLDCKRVQRLEPQLVKGKNGKPRFLGAGVFRVDHAK